MGQYYYPISLDKMEYLYSHDYDNGLKLMEHSWIGNNFVHAVENAISKGGKWFKDRIVWAGDYADVEEGTEENLHSMVDKKVHFDDTPNKLRYLVNLDTREYVDKIKIPVSDIHNNHEYKINPLPLLTCEGNGRGGGDYHKEHHLTGTWSRNRVILQKTKPRNGKEIIFNLIE